MKFYDVSVIYDPCDHMDFDATREFDFVVLAEDHIVKIRASKPVVADKGKYTLVTKNYYRLTWDTDFSINTARQNMLVYFAAGSNTD